MQLVRLQPDATLADWRGEARRLIAAEVSPERVVWAMDACLLAPAEVPAHASPASIGFNVPARFIEMAEAAACFRDDGRWALLYRVVCG